MSSMEEWFAFNRASYRLSNVRPWQEIFASRPSISKPKLRMIQDANEVPSFGTTTSIEDHNRMKKILSHAFSDGALKEQEYILHKYTNLLIRRLQELVDSAGKGWAEVDVCAWYNFTTFDTIGDLRSWNYLRRVFPQPRQFGTPPLGEVNFPGHQVWHDDDGIRSFRVTTVVGEMVPTTIIQAQHAYSCSIGFGKDRSTNARENRSAGLYGVYSPE